MEAELLFAAGVMNAGSAFRLVIIVVATELSVAGCATTPATTPDQNGRKQSIVRSEPGSAEPADIFEPHMPPVDVLSDMDGLFADARKQSQGAREGEGGSVVVVTPGRMRMILDRCCHSDDG